MKQPIVSEIKSDKIIAVVTLFDPSMMLINSIESYCDCVDSIILWKNSRVESSIHKALTTKFHGKCLIIGDEDNRGVGFALNALIKEAVSNGASIVLTMDQDSIYEAKSAEVLLKEVINRSDPLALYSSGHKISNNYQLSRNDNPNWVMTSGNCFRIELLNFIGLFNEEYFIDGVDIEWCGRLKLAGGKIKTIPNSVLRHHLGATKVHNIFGKKFIATNHAPFRYYYIYRNYLDLIFMKPTVNLSHKLKVLKVLAQITISIIFFEKQKINKLNNAIVGIKDFIYRTSGPRK